MLLIIKVNAPSSSPLHDDPKHEGSPTTQDNGRKGDAEAGATNDCGVNVSKFIDNIILGRVVSEDVLSNMRGRSPIA